MLRVLASPATQPPDGNPYITLLYGAVRAHGVQVDDFDRRKLLDRYDVIHVHWPQALVRWSSPMTAAQDVAKVLALLRLAKARGSKLIWTGHDLRPHDSIRPGLHRFYVSAFTRMVDGWISLGDAAADVLREEYPQIRDKPCFVIRHGHYRGAYGDAPDKAVARKQLELPPDAPVLLLLGQIRRYKNVPKLIQAFGDVHGAHLVVAGEVRGDPDLATEVEQAAVGNPNVTVKLGIVPSADIPAWHAAADVVVLPYSPTSALHSGAAFLALSYNRPVVATDTTTMRELQTDVGSEWLHLSDGSPFGALSGAMSLLHEHRAETVDLSRFDWPALGAQTVAAYEEIRRSG